MSKKVIKAILTDLYKNRDTLAGNKFSGVHFVNGVYRVHMSKFIPGYMSLTDRNIYRKITLIVEDFCTERMKWDECSLWLTMSD